MKKADQRVMMTKLMLKDALILLLNKKSLTDISITQLCKEANINRNTFYNHFDNITDLYNEIEAQLINDIVLTLKKRYSSKERLYEICKIIKKHFVFVKLTFSQENKIQTINRLLLKTRSIFSYDYSKNTNIYLFVESGTTAIIKNWVLNDCDESPEKMSLLLSNINNRININ